MKNQTISTDFVANLLSQLSEKDNSVISPYGIAEVLSMAAEGANEDSLKEILTCLGFASLDELRSAVLDVIENPCAAFTPTLSASLPPKENERSP